MTVIWVSIFSGNGPLDRYAKLRVSHASGIPGTFSPPPQISDPGMHHDACVTHVPWCMPESLISGFLWSRWRGKRSRHSRCMRNPQFYVSGKRPMAWHLFIKSLLTYCWLVVSLAPRHILQSNSSQNMNVFYQDNAFDNVVYKMSVILLVNLDNHLRDKSLDRSVYHWSNYCKWYKWCKWDFWLICFKKRGVWRLVGVEWYVCVLVFSYWYSSIIDYISDTSRTSQWYDYACLSAIYWTHATIIKSIIAYRMQYLAYIYFAYRE